MKNLPRFSPFLFCLLGFLFQSSLFASFSNSYGPELSKTCETEAGFSTLVVCNTPTWPVTSNITDHSATFSWDAVSGAQSYAVQTRVPNGTWYTVPGSPFTSTWATVDWFQPNTTYEWRVRTNCYGGETSYWTNPITFTTTGYSDCDAPSWLYTNNITQTSATFDWDPVSGAQSYSLQYRLAGGSWWDVSGGPWTETWHTVNGLQPGTAYEWRVRSNCPNWMYSDWSYPASFTTLGYSCSTPTWPVTSNITDHSATFSWDAVSGAQSYAVQTRVPNGTWYTVPGSPFTSTWANVDWFLPNTTYEWRVRANCYGGETSYWTNPVTFTTTGYGYCDAPSWLYTNNITQNSATFDWDPVSGAQSYSLQYRLAGGSWWDVTGGPWTETWHTVTGLQPGTAYEWRVRSNCANWMYSDWSYPASFTTLGYSCSTPTWPVTSNITDHSATFSWDAVSGAQSYAVQTRVPNGTWYTVPGSPFTSTWATVDWFLPNTTYEWRVRANCYGGETSYWTNPVTFTTTGYGYCDAPSWLYTNNITQNSATFDWDPVSGAQSYSLQYRLAGGSWWDVSGGPWTETWHTVTGLQPGTAYEWRVRSNCANWTYSDWSYPASFTTLGYSCVHPYWLYTSNITQSSAKLTWDHVPDAVSYSIQMRVSGGYWYDLPGGPWYGTWFTVENLQPGTCYEWRVRSNCSNWNYSSWSYPEPFCTMGNYCSAPTWPSTWDVTHTSATFSWDEVWGAYNYTVQVRLPNGDWWDVAGSPTHNTWINVTGLNSCTTYHWRVKTNCGSGNYSYWTQPIVFTTLCNYACEAPNWLYTSNISQTSATLGWEPVYGAISYSVQYRTSGGNWQYLPGGPWTNTWTSISGLQPNTTYEWRVKSNCYSWVSSDWSYTAWFTTTGNTCYRPSYLSTHDITATSATLKWSSVWGAWSYSVQIRLPNGSWSEIPGSPFTDNSAQVTGLTPGTTYQWRVRTNCEDGGYSLWAKPVSFTTESVPTCYAPAWVFTSYITETSANFDWGPVYNATSYSIQWKMQGDTAWTDLPGGPWTETWHTVNGLMPGTHYQWRVRSNCNNGLYSDWSAIASFITLGPTCATPSGCYTATITDTSAGINWSAVPGAQSYGVQIRVPLGTWTEVTGSPFADISATIDGLIPGTNYEWRVRANCFNGDHSPWTSALSFSTTGTQAGGSDECDNATELTVNSECINSASSNVGSTESTPPPVGWCAENEYNDVWFTFTMPDVNDPVVTIRTSPGTLRDAIMEVYRGGGCADLEYIFCEDDNSYANGSFMPVITITGSAGERIWVRLWGYAGTTGTFNICVFDYQSNNYGVEDETDNPVDGKPLDPLMIASPSGKDRAVSSSLHVYPNPTKDVLQVSFTQSKESIVSRIVLMDMSGKIVFRQVYPANNFPEFRDQVDVSDLAPGIYLLQAVTSSGIISEKVSVVD